MTHFGNGDECDQNVLKQFFSDGGFVYKKLTIFPGANYGHLEFLEVEAASKFMDSLEVKNCLNLEFKGSTNPDRTVVFYYTPFAANELKKSENIEVPLAKNAETGDINGLFVFDDFITLEEEQTLMKEIDKNEWTKMLMRRVQHYGFEFKYGSNDVDKDAQMGKLPSFCDFLIPKFEKILKAFKTNQATQAVMIQPNVK